MRIVQRRLPSFTWDRDLYIRSTLSLAHGPITRYCGCIVPLRSGPMQPNRVIGPFARSFAPLLARGSARWGRRSGFAGPPSPPSPHCGLLFRRAVARRRPSLLASLRRSGRERFSRPGRPSPLPFRPSGAARSPGPCPSGAAVRPGFWPGALARSRFLRVPGPLRVCSAAVRSPQHRFAAEGFPGDLERNPACIPWLLPI